MFCFATTDPSPPIPPAKWCGSLPMSPAGQASPSRSTVFRVGSSITTTTVGMTFSCADITLRMSEGSVPITSDCPTRPIDRAYTVTTSGGFGNLQTGHGVSFADIDNDGDQDIYENMGGAVSGDVYHNVLYENPGHGNHWITLKLEGVQSNRAAIGARIRIVAKCASGEKSYYKTVSTGGSFGASPLRQEMGLGQAQTIVRVEIFWPCTGKTQVLTDLEMDRFYRVKEGQAEATPWKLKSFRLDSKAGEVHGHHHHS